MTAHDNDARARSPRSAAWRLLAAAVVLLAGGAFWLSRSQPRAAEIAGPIPAPIVDAAPVSGAQMQVAVLAGGCFWGVQGVFQHMKGVTSAVSGYAGGDKKSAHYNMVSAGTTGHAETVRITFDPRQISYGRILQVFFSVAHDPTQLNRQGRTPARNIARPSSPRTPSRRRSPRRISISSTRPACSTRRSSPRSSRSRASTPRRSTIRTFWCRIPRIPTS